MTGFTGVDWDSRTTEQLATDLGAGPGPAPLAEAGLAWASLATEIGEAGIEYAAVLARLGVHWRSAHASAAFEKLTRLAPWFAETATRAADNALRAESQAAAITVARLQMPDLAEVDVVEKLQEITTTATAVAPIIAGAAAQAERAVHQQRLRAARVMQTYEQATEPVGTPWESGRPAPDLVSGQALATERAAAAHAAEPPVAPVSAPAALPMFGGFPGAHVAPAEKLRYAPTVVAAGQPQAAPPVPTSGTSPTSTGPGVPPPMAPGVVPADRTTAIRTVAADPAADVSEVPSASESAEPATPVTWADIATADRPAAHYVSDPGRDDASGVDPRYHSETLLLGRSGDSR
ncbi:PPE domain-containing protein [Gordonia sp. 'Campus']|uniref:PPE domain-containing protein n=1 Tax=Gordonia sp. 'Campus' TaxID=2915824 RepID=UPI001EE44019|nr:PPE domain-containing protein [Gordonia sp. 'Campus']